MLLSQLFKLKIIFRVKFVYSDSKTIFAAQTTIKANTLTK